MLTCYKPSVSFLYTQIDIQTDTLVYRQKYIDRKVDGYIDEQIDRKRQIDIWKDGQII